MFLYVLCFLYLLVTSIVFLCRAISVKSLRVSKHIYININIKFNISAAFPRRSHLNDIRDRSVLRLFESAEGGPSPQGLTIAAPTWDQDQSYFSEPEFDSEYQHQHIHKTKVSR